MKEKKITDEILLSYILGDCEQSLENEIKSQLKNNRELNKRLKAISFLSKEIKNSNYKVKVNKVSYFKYFVRQLIFSSAVFTIGLLVQSNFNVLSIKNKDVLNRNISMSKELSWDGPFFNSLM